MGPILPQTNVFGKELGISPDVMGFITSFLPILYILAKPAVGYLIDSFPVTSICSKNIFYSRNGDHSKRKTERKNFIFITASAKNDIHVNCSSNDSLLRWFLSHSNHSGAEYFQTIIVQFQPKRWHL